MQCNTSRNATQRWDYRGLSRVPVVEVLQELVWCLWQQFSKDNYVTGLLSDVVLAITLDAHVVTNLLNLTSKCSLCDPHCPLGQGEGLFLPR